MLGDLERRSSSMGSAQIPRVIRPLKEKLEELLFAKNARLWVDKLALGAFVLLARNIKRKYKKRHGS
jgi:hypothetical protein